MISVIPSVVLATGTGTDVDVDIETEDFEPLVWMCDSRIVLDDPGQWGRVSQNDQIMAERDKNYAFEGESITWEVLVMDKNGINKIEDVFATIGSSQGAGNDIEVNCVEDLDYSEIIDRSCDATILEEDLTGKKLNTKTQRYYTCTLTIETADSHYGEYWITVEATDLDGLSGTMDENEFWFLNPIIALSIDGSISFENVRPGVSAYSDTLLVGNDAEAGSGVEMDMFISGTNFYDSASSGAACPNTNELNLDAFRYFATNGAYSTLLDVEMDTGFQGTYDVSTVRNKDTGGYVNIQHGDHWDRSMYEEAEIIQSGLQVEGPGPHGYFRGNTLTPGSEMAVTFKLNLPEPCNGDFDTGSIYFWGEAI
ncbi:MAG: hypothetical protein V1944_00585 [Candidatus Aenigmatarchaeota archaeon]